MKIKDLKEVIDLLPDDGEVYVQRVEDKYFEKNGWTVKLMEGEHYHRWLQRNADIDSGRFLDKEQYPRIKPEFLVKLTDEELEASKEQYIDTHCCINYDGVNLYITSHY